MTICQQCFDCGESRQSADRLKHEILLNLVITIFLSIVASLTYKCFFVSTLIRLILFLGAISILGFVPPPPSDLNPPARGFLLDQMIRNQWQVFFLQILSGILKTSKIIFQGLLQFFKLINSNFSSEGNLFAKISLKSIFLKHDLRILHLLKFAFPVNLPAFAC